MRNSVHALFGTQGRKIFLMPSKTTIRSLSKSVSAIYWVNLSKRGGMERVFPVLAALSQWIFQGQSPREILKSRPAWGKPHPTRLLYSGLHHILMFLYYIREGTNFATIKYTRVKVPSRGSVVKALPSCRWVQIRQNLYFLPLDGAFKFCIVVSSSIVVLCMVPPRWGIRFRVVPPKLDYSGS